MNPVQKYRLYIVIVVLGCLYILLTEGWDRWEKVIQEWRSLNEKTSTILTPEEISGRKLELHSELATLRASLIRNSQGCEQSEAGLVELIGETAKKEVVGIEALTPAKQEEGNGLTVALEIRGSFHGIAAFLNNLENSPIPLKLERLEMSHDTGRFLYVKMALKATFLRFGGRK